MQSIQKWALKVGSISYFVYAEIRCVCSPPVNICPCSLLKLSLIQYSVVGNTNKRSVHACIQKCDAVRSESVLDFPLLCVCAPVYTRTFI